MVRNLTSSSAAMPPLLSLLLLLLLLLTLSECNEIRTHNHLVYKRTLNHLAKLASLAKWLSVLLRTNWLWVQIPLQSLKLQMAECSFTNQVILGSNPVTVT